MKRSAAERIGFFFIILPFILMLVALATFIIQTSEMPIDKYAAILALALVALTYETKHTFFNSK